MERRQKEEKESRDNDDGCEANDEKRDYYENDFEDEVEVDDNDESDEVSNRRIR